MDCLFVGLCDWGVDDCVRQVTGWQFQRKNNDSSSAAAGDSSNEKAEDSLSSEDLAKNAETR